jgi:hypothetical protein
LHALSIPHSFPYLTPHARHVQLGEFGGDNRAGVDRTLHRISCMRNRSGRVIGLTCRVGRAIPGSAKMVEDLVLSGASVPSARQGHGAHLCIGSTN